MSSAHYDFSVCERFTSRFFGFQDGMGDGWMINDGSWMTGIS